LKEIFFPADQSTGKSLSPEGIGGSVAIIKEINDG